MNSRSVELYLVLFLLGILVCTFGGHGSTVDENLVAQVVESISTRGELTCAKMFQALPGPDGKYYSRYGIGFPLLLVPFYRLGDLLQWAFPQALAFSGSPQMFCMLSATLGITVLTGWIFYRLCRLLGAKNPPAVCLTLGLILSSSFWPYSQTLYRLTASTAILLQLLYWVIQYETQPSKFILMGMVLLVAFGLNVREDLVFAFLAFGIFALARGTWEQRWKRAAALNLGAVLGLFIWGLHNYIRFHTFFIENYADLSFDCPLIFSIPQLLWGLKRGLILYSPLALILLFSWGAAKRNKAMDVWLLGLVILTAYFIFYGKSSMWHGGVCWGPRHLYFLLPFALLPGIWLYQEYSNKWTKGFFIGAFIIGMAMNWPGVYAHQGKYQSYFQSPTFWELFRKPVESPLYVGLDDLDLWWIRMIKLEPFSLWPLVFLGLILMTGYWGYRLFYSLREEDRNLKVSKDI